MNIELEKITLTNRPILENLFQYYLHDMSQFADWPFSKDGTFDYPKNLLQPYWDSMDHYPYFIVQNGEIAGFSLVRRSPTNDMTWDMGQFFLLRKFRGTGLGRDAFVKSIEGFQGHWQVRVLPTNAPAYRFWRKIIGDISNGNFSEMTKDYNDISMTFFSFQNDTET